MEILCEHFGFDLGLSDRDEDEPAGFFKPGATCVLQGLSAEQYNGTMVKLESFDFYALRWRCRVFGKTDQLNIKPINLRCVDEEMQNEATQREERCLGYMQKATSAPKLEASAELEGASSLPMHS